MYKKYQNSWFCHFLFWGAKFLSKFSLKGILMTLALPLSGWNVIPLVLSLRRPPSSLPLSKNPPLTTAMQSERNSSPSSSIKGENTRDDIIESLRKKLIRSKTERCPFPKPYPRFFLSIFLKWYIGKIVNILWKEHHKFLLLDISHSESERNSSHSSSIRGQNTISQTLPKVFLVGFFKNDILERL